MVVVSLVLYGEDSGGGGHEDGLLRADCDVLGGEVGLQYSE